MIKKKSGLRSLPNITISFLYDQNANQEIIKRNVEQIINNTYLTKGIKTHVKDQLRIVNTNRKTIAAMLTSYQKQIKTFNPQKKPGCCGHEDCRDGKHLKKNMRDFDGIIGEIGKLNAKNWTRIQS
jgi:hypothetical protein